MLLFAVAASICEEMSAKGSCQKGGAYELPIYLAGRHPTTTYSNNPGKVGKA